MVLRVASSNVLCHSEAPDHVYVLGMKQVSNHAVACLAGMNHMTRATMFCHFAGELNSSDEQA